MEVDEGQDVHPKSSAALLDRETDSVPGEVCGAREGVDLGGDQNALCRCVERGERLPDPGFASAGSVLVRRVYEREPAVNGGHDCGDSRVLVDLVAVLCGKAAECAGAGAQDWNVPAGSSQFSCVHQGRGSFRGVGGTPGRPEPGGGAVLERTTSFGSRSLVSDDSRLLRRSRRRSTATRPISSKS